MIIIKPRGGLCNRLRAIDSAIGLAAKNKLKVAVIWEMNRECNCKFSELFFVPEEIYRLTEIDNGFVVNHLNEMAPAFFSHFNNLFLDQERIDQLMIRGGWFDIVSNFNHAYIDSYSRFYPITLSSSFFSLNPRPSIQEKINSYKVDNMVGVHVRRTDHMEAIAYSPIEKFIESMNIEIDRDKNVKFFLSTDSPSVERELRDVFPTRIISHSKKSLDRKNPVAIQDAVIDLLCLANSRKLIGSHWSSFSGTAAEIHGIDKVSIKSETFSMAPFASGKHSLKIKLKPDVLVCESDSGELVVETNTGKRMKLNNTSAAILNVCYQSMTVADILSLFRSTYPDAPESLENDILKTLEMLFESNIIDAGVTGWQEKHHI